MKVVAWLCLLSWVALASEKPSTVRVRCMDDCTVTVDGKGGVRETPRQWVFTNQAPGQKRVEAKGSLGRPLFAGFTLIPAGKEVTFQVDGSKRLVSLEEKPLGSAAPRALASGAGDSRLLVRCPKPCTVFVDGQRKAGNPQGATVDNLGTGEHSVEVKSTFNELMARGRVLVPKKTEVYVTASNLELKVTNTRPLSR